MDSPVSSIMPVMFSKVPPSSRSLCMLASMDGRNEAPLPFGGWPPLAESCLFNTCYCYCYS